MGIEFFCPFNLSVQKHKQVVQVFLAFQLRLQESFLDLQGVTDLLWCVGAYDFVAKAPAFLVKRTRGRLFFRLVSARTHVENLCRSGARQTLRNKACSPRAFHVAVLLFCNWARKTDGERPRPWQWTILH